MTIGIAFEEKEPNKVELQFWLPLPEEPIGGKLEVQAARLMFAAMLYSKKSLESELHKEGLSITGNQLSPKMLKVLGVENASLSD